MKECIIFRQHLPVLNMSDEMQTSFKWVIIQIIRHTSDHCIKNLCHRIFVVGGVVLCFNVDDYSN